MNQAKYEDVPRAVAQLGAYVGSQGMGRTRGEKTGQWAAVISGPALCLGKSLEFQVMLKDNFTMVLRDASHGQGINLGAQFLSEMNQPLWI